MLQYYLPNTGNLRFPSYKGNTSSIKTPVVSTARRAGLGVDALDAVAGMPGSVSNYYGFSGDKASPNYIFGNRYLGKLQSDWSKGIKTGGNEQLVKILSNLGTSKGMNQAFVKADPTIGSKFATYFKTGKLPTFTGVNDAKRASQAYDYALRAIGADAVGDRKSGFLGSIAKSFIGPVVGAVLLPGVGGLLGAKISAAVGGAVGGAIQGGVSDGVKGAVFGAAQGWSTGNFIGSIGSKLSTAAHAIGKPAWGAALTPKLTSVNTAVAAGFKSPSFIAGFAGRTGIAPSWATAGTSWTGVGAVSPWVSAGNTIASVVNKTNLAVSAVSLAKAVTAKPKTISLPSPKTTAAPRPASRPSFMSALLSERSQARINFQREGLGKTNFSVKGNGNGLIKRRVY